jgi:AraC family ethanolamine operon transcriptional activator
MQNQAVTVESSFRDFDELRGQLRGVDLELIPLRAGPAAGKTRAVVSADFVFTAGKFVSDHRFRGGTHESQVLLGLHYGRNCSVHYETTPGQPGDLTFHQPRSENFGRMSGTFEYAALSIDRAELARLSDGVVGHDVLLDASGLIRAPADVAQLACDELSRLAKVAFRPANFHSDARVQMLKRALIYPYLLVAAHGATERGSRVDQTQATIVRRAEAWLDGEVPQSIHTIDLCHALGLPLRSVQRAFQETLGIGPAHYLAHYRVHKIRQVLLSCNPFDTHVSDVALDHGFWELGRFARFYRQTYGENPSATIRRRRQEAGPKGSSAGGSATSAFPL